MLYEVLVISSGGERLTIERDAPLAGGDIFEEDFESYQVLAIETGHGPFAGVIEAERLSSAESLRADDSMYPPPGSMRAPEPPHGEG